MTNTVKNVTVLDFLKSRKATDIRPYWCRYPTGGYSISFISEGSKDRTYIYSSDDISDKLDKLQSQQLIDINLNIYEDADTGAIIAYKLQSSMSLDELVAASQ